MRQFWGSVLLVTVGLLGLLASLDPMRPVVFVLVLRTDRPRVNAIAFLIGWAMSLAVLFCVGFLAFGAGVSGRPSSAQRTWASVLELLLAVLLLVLAARRWRHRHDTTVHPTTPQAILRRLDRLNPRSAGLLGVLIQPWTLTLAAALVVARERSGFLSVLTGVVVFAAVSTAALLSIFTYFVRRPDNAESRLTGVASRLEQAGPMIFTVVCALGGSYLFVNGVLGLMSS